MGTALFDKPPFLNCMAHGVILGSDKQKLSKRLRNYPDPDEMFAAFGADAMRWFLLSSPVVRGGDIVVERKGPSEAVRGVLNPLWNAWKFFAMYANADGHQAAPDHRRRRGAGPLHPVQAAVAGRRSHRAPWTPTTFTGRAGS